MFRTLISKAASVAAGAALAFSFSAAPAHSASLSLSYPDSCSITGTVPSLTMTCTSGPPPPGAPTGCTLTPANTVFGAGGGSVTLTAFCSGGTLPINFSLTGGPFQGMTGTQSSASVGFQFNPVQVTASTTVGGSASNGTLPNASLSTASITVGGGGGGGFANCTAHGLNVLPAAGVNVPWGTGMNPISSQYGSFGDGNTTAVVFTITPPAGTPTSTQFGRFTVSEYGAPQTERQMVISTMPCDFFRPLDITGANGPLAVVNDAVTAELYYGVRAASFYWAGMTAGTTYYVSIRNWQTYPAPGNSCGVTSCTAIMSVQPASP